MTATASRTDEEKIMNICDMLDPTVIRYNPVMKNQMFFKIPRPPSRYGFLGKEDDDPCTLELIKILVLNKFINSVKSGKEHKVAIIFVQSFQELNTINNYLLVELQKYVEGINKLYILIK